MTTAYWIGPASAGKPRTSGDYFTGTNWSTGVVPGASQQGADDAYLPAGTYVVTLAGGGISLRSLSIGVGATFAVANGGLGVVQLAQSSVNNGTLSFGIDNFGTFAAGFYNFGAIVSTGDNVRLSGSTIFNTGQIVADGSMSIASNIVNDVGATIRAAAGLALGGVITNRGEIVADHADILVQPITGMLTNLANGVLTGGSYAALGASNMTFYQSLLVELAAGTDVTLDGVGATISGVDQTNGSLRSLDSTLTRIDTGAALHVLGARDYTTNNILALEGTLDLGGGTLTAGQLNTRAGSLFTGFGTVNARATVAGDLVATDTLTFATRATVTGAVSGDGTLVLAGDVSAIGTSAITVANLTISGDTRLDVDLSYAHHFAVSGARLDLGTHQLRLTGAVDLADDRIDGANAAMFRIVGGHLASTGNSVINVNTINTGTIEVASGQLDVARKLSGTGLIAIDDGATLSFSSSATVTAAQTLSFADGQGILKIANAAHFHARLSAFAAGDAIDLTGIAPGGATARWIADDDGSGGTLRVSGTNATTRLRIDDGQYTSADFTLTADGTGGTTVTTVAVGAFRTAPVAAFAPHEAAHVEISTFHEPVHPAALTILA